MDGNGLYLNLISGSNTTVEQLIKLVIDTSLKLLIFELNIYETYESSFLYSRLCC